MSSFIQTFGGIGLFLFGMAVMTSGLRKIAGSRLRQWLANSTRTPLSGVVTGATMTAIIQSSSATTVAAIGFVGAGLMTFSQALGIIFGANIGTTLTGWMVALIGFKLKLGTIALPIMFVAALLYLVKKQRILHGIGKALSGFCLIFIGISFLQDGMSAYQEVIDLSGWEANHFGGRLLLLLVGVIMTIITQSSSATVATAVTALNTGFLDLPQCASVIIGADIGTTVTAALATVGGSTASRRTGMAHVIYNIMTGIVAFSILPLFLWVADRAFPDVVGHSPEVVAVMFHSFFNILGVIMILPFTGAFARMIERMFPEEASPLVSAFDTKLLEDVEAAEGGLISGSRRLAAVMLGRAARVLDPSGKKENGPDLSEIREAVLAGREFATRIGQRAGEETELDPNVVFGCIHLIDHVERLADRTSDDERAREARGVADLNEKAKEVARDLRALSESLTANENVAELGAKIARSARNFEEDKSNFRQWAIKQAATGKWNAEQLDEALDAHRWLRRMTYHAGRIAHYLPEQAGIR